MSYFVRKKGARPINDRLSGLGATASSWGEQASLDPSLTQPTPAPPTQPKKDEGGWGSELAKILGALALSKVGPSAPATGPYVVAPQPSGISSTTLLIGGGLALGALVLLMKD